MSQRVFVTLPDAVHQELEEWAETQERYVLFHRLSPPLSNLTAFLVEAALKTAKEQGEFVPHKQRSLQK